MLTSARMSHNNSPTTARSRSWHLTKMVDGHKVETLSFFLRTPIVARLGIVCFSSSWRQTNYPLSNSHWHATASVSGDAGSHQRRAFQVPVGFTLRALGRLPLHPLDNDHFLKWCKGVALFTGPPSVSLNQRPLLRTIIPPAGWPTATRSRRGARRRQSSGCARRCNRRPRKRRGGRRQDAEPLHQVSCRPNEGVSPRMRSRRLSGRS